MYFQLVYRLSSKQAAHYPVKFKHSSKSGVFYPCTDVTLHLYSSLDSSSGGIGSRRIRSCSRVPRESKPSAIAPGTRSREKLDAEQQNGQDSRYAGFVVPNKHYGLDVVAMPCGSAEVGEERMLRRAVESRMEDADWHRRRCRC